MVFCFFILFENLCSSVDFSCMKRFVGQKTYKMDFAKKKENKKKKVWRWFSYNKLLDITWFQQHNSDHCKFQETFNFVIHSYFYYFLFGFLLFFSFWLCSFWEGNDVQRKAFSNQSSNLSAAVILKYKSIEIYYVEVK